MKIIQKTFSYRLMPSKAHLALFAQFAGSARFIYNYGLNLIKKAFESKAEIPTYVEIANLLPLLKNAAGTEWLKKIHSQVLQQALKDLENALNHFFRRLKLKQEPGFPRFKCRGASDSFRYPQYIECLDGKVYLPKIGWVNYHDSRPIEGIIKQAVVKRKGKHWFVHIVCNVEVRISPRVIRPDKIVGMDLGLTHLAYLSNGQVIENQKFLKKDLKKLQRLQSDLSRKQKGSNNRKKAVLKVQEQHIKIADRRKDFHHKISTDLVENQDVIIVEDLNIKGMIKNRRLSRAIADAGWCILLEYVKYKAAWAEKIYIEVDRFAPTSKSCSTCKEVKEICLCLFAAIFVKVVDLI